MIKQTVAATVSLDSIYNEIINLAASIGECKSSIEHLDIRIQDLNNRLDMLSEDKIRREQNYKILWGLFQFSPGIIVKTLLLLSFTMLVSILPFSNSFRTMVANFIK